LIHILSYSFDYFQFSLILFVGLLVGMSKTGIQGTGLLSVPLMALVFGGQASSGFILPMLIIGDVFGVWYYHRYANWIYLKKLFIWAAIGAVLGTVIGVYINDTVFRYIMAVVIIICVLIMIYMEKSKEIIVPKHPFFAPSMGVAGGITSMIGNLAGAVMSVYFLAMRMTKDAYIGTTAWFFLFLNVFKVPFHLFVWNTINLNSLLINFITIPAILLGAYIGISISKKLSDITYRWFIIAITLLAAILMLLK
jgi:uncharacterized membrane protein YfcA